MTRLLLLFSLCFPISAFAQIPETEVESSLDQVTVFLNGAQVHRSASVQLPAGQSNIRFVGLDPDLNSESVQLNAGGLTVLSVTHQRNFLEPTREVAEVEALRERIKEKRDSIAVEQLMQDVYEREELMLAANQSIGGTASGVELGQLESAADFFRRRLTEIKSARLVHARRVEQLESEIQVLESQLQRLSASLQPRPSSEIVVLVDRSSAGSSTFELSYVTRRANWRPVYDLRVEDIARPLMLHYKASIGQSTSEDWENTRLTLSTADPSQRGVKPVVRPQYVRFYSEVEELDTMGGERPEARSEADLSAFANEFNASPPAAEMEYVAVQTRTNTTSIEFEIDTPYTIDSDADPSLVDIAQHEVEAEYEYYAAPARSKDAYLTARLTGWEAYNLLSGSANLFFNNTFVGTSYLDMQNVSDTLDLSLGLDQGLVVKRTRLEEFSKKQFLGGRRTDTAAYEIEIRNTKTVPVHIVIEDQIPLSSDGNIDVSLEEDGGANYREETGILRWELDIPPGSTETMQFRYTIRYPNDRRIFLQ